MIANLRDVLQDAARNHYAVAGVVCLGWEDMRGYARAAEAERRPLILQAGPGCRKHTPLPILGAMMCHVADSVSVPVVVHLDHSRSIDECRAALAAGFTGLMFDGSHLPLLDNIAQTRAVVELAQGLKVGVEGEIGQVGYAAGAASLGTDAEEAQRFAQRTGVDAMAVSIGNVHLQTDSVTLLDEQLLRQIEALTDVPLVIHGGSGVDPKQRAELGRSSGICKYNIGTELRREFGRELRLILAEHPERFDRNEIFSDLEDRMVEVARRMLRSL